MVGNIIFPNLSLPELGACSRVCKVWSKTAKKYINAFSYENAFGPKEWFAYFGCHFRNVPRLPLKIAEIMNSPCPFWPDKKVYETHLLVFIPQSVKGHILTLETLGNLVKKTQKPGNSTQYRNFYLGQYTDPAAPPSHWVLMTRDVIRGSRNKNYQAQQVLLNQKAGDWYEVPNILDATVCIFMEYVRSSMRLYSNSPSTYTRCQEKYDADWQLGVGAFDQDGLDVGCDFGGIPESCGVGGSRKF